MIIEMGATDEAMSREEHKIDISRFVCSRLGSWLVEQRQLVTPRTERWNTLTEVIEAINGFDAEARELERALAMGFDVDARRFRASKSAL